MQEYEKFLAELNRAQVEYVVVGGFAVGLNGFVRMTEDVDILVEDSRDNLNRLIHFFENYGEGHAKGLRLEDFTEDEGCIRIIETFPVDIFTKMSGKKLKDFSSFIAHATIGENSIPYLNAEAMIWLKKGSWREKDLLDVAELRRLSAKKSSLCSCIQNFFARLKK